MLAIWSLFPLPIAETSLTTWKFMVHVLLKPGLETFEHYFASVWDECNCAAVWAFFGIGMKSDLFQSSGHCWGFQICWHIEWNTFTASSFRIWNSSVGNPSPPLDLFIVMLSKAHLTSHSKMSGSRLVITSSWLSGSWRSFLYSYSVYSCHLFLISSASVRSIPFLSFIDPIFAWHVPLVSLIFLKRSLVFPILLFSSISLRLRGRRMAERSYSMSKVRRGSREEIPLVQGKEERLCFAGAAVKRFPTSKVREIQVRW